MVRLKDIADKAGVSVMTVSKVLRDAPDISAPTKARIRLLAQQMGYVPDSMAQGLRTRTTRLLGLVISASSNPIFGQLIMAIEERAQELGYELILAHSLNQLEREEACIRRLLSRRVDGLFIAPVYRLAPSAAIYDELLRRMTPTVIIGHRGSFCSQFSNVESDDLLASYTATEHLLQMGHKRIAFFAGPPASPTAQERLEGYRRALREAQLEVDDRLIFAAGTTIDDGTKAALQMINESVSATAIQAMNDLVAIGAAKTLLQQGFQIPRDISVVGFGNTQLSEFFRVPLTTLGQPQYRLGTAAIEVMKKLIQREKPDSKRLPVELIVRESCAPPNAARS